MSEIAIEQDASETISAWPGFVEIELPDMPELIGPAAYEAQIKQVIAGDPSGYNRRRVLGRISVNY